MKLTALEIKQQQFEKSLRGYDVGEVKAFLNVVSTEWEYLIAKNRELVREVEQVKDRLRHYERVEQALHETLQTAKENADQRIAGAKKEVRNRMEKAEMDAESIVGKARQQRHEIRQNIRTLLDRREEIIRGMRSYLDLAQESLHGFSKDDSGIFTLTRDEEADADAKAANAPAPKPRKEASQSEDNSTAFLIPDADDLDDFLDKIE